MSGAPTLRFLGAAGTVTGSKYLLKSGDTRVLVDCGLFQGLKNLRARNRQPLPVDATRLDAVLLTHAHLDHTGYLPVLVKQGFTGPVYCTSGTEALSRVLLPDAGHLQEEDARYANRKGFSKHAPALPLYTQGDAEASLEALQRVPFDQPLAVSDDLSVQFHSAGHILGASWLRCRLGERTLTFSGDLGRIDDPVMNPPSALKPTDYLVLESTYGNRVHARTSPLDQLQAVVNRTAERNGVLLIPAFAVGRAQTVLHLLATLRAAGSIPALPVFLNSPMAIDATEIFCAHTDEHRLSAAECRTMCGNARYVNSADDSRALHSRSGPMIIVSASGMASGGRILHHFKRWLGDARNTVLFTGFQAAGTRGAAMVAGAKRVRIHGADYAIAAEIAELASLSAHADRDELIDWIAPLQDTPPHTVFITHGEQAGATALRGRIDDRLGYSSVVPLDGQAVELT